MDHQAPRDAESTAAEQVPVPDYLVELAPGVWGHADLSPEAVEASFAAMATDEDYRRLSEQLDREFATASYEALLLGEAQLQAPPTSTSQPRARQIS